MYLVELRPGKEELYRSVDELAAAIRSGDVDAHSRIFHRATSKWISVTLHPQFKAIAAARESEPPVASPKKQWTFLTSATEELQAEEGRVADTAEPPASVSEAEAATGTGNLWRRAAAFGAAGLLLVGGMQVAASVPRPEWRHLASEMAKRASEHLNRAAAGAAAVGAAATSAATSAIQTSAAARQSVVSLASTATWAPVSYPLPPAPTAKRGAAVRPAAPPSAPTAQLPGAVGDSVPVAGAEEVVSVATLIGQYESAYEEARSRLQNVLHAVPLDQLFAPARLSSADSVAAVRLDIAAAKNAVRAYRRRETEIEQSQQDTFAVLSRQLAWSSKDVLRWYARPSRRESAEAAARADAVLGTADSLLAVLAANQGGYRMNGSAILFDRQEAVAEYGRLRQQLEDQLDSARADRMKAASGALAVLLDAFGSARPLAAEPSPTT